MPPIAIAAGIGVAGSIGSGILAKKGADAQAAAAEKASAAAVAENKRQFDLSRADLAPWISTGGQAIQQLGWLLGIAPGGAAPGAGGQTGGVAPISARSGLPPVSRFTNPAGAAPSSAGYDPATFGLLNKDFTLADFEKDPGYDFRMAEGQKALERSAAARGGLFSGRAMKEISRYGQNFASNEYGNAFNRFEAQRAGRYNRLAGLAQGGAQVAGQQANLGADYARTNADITIGGATSAAASRASGANALAQGISGGINTGLNWYLLSSLMKNKQSSSEGWV